MRCAESLRVQAYFDGQLDALTLRQHRFGREQHPVAAHVEGLAQPYLLYALFSSEHFVTDVPLDRHSI